jgi:GT2 family glycosyltransferase
LNKELNDKIAVVIVNRNTKELLRNCLESLPIGFSGIPYDVWVVDNASDDGSREMVRRACPDVHLISNTENLGFAKANNQALKQIRHPFVLLLNSDTILTKDCISKLYHFLIDNNEAAIVGPKLINRDGTLQFSTYPLPQLWKDLLMNFKFYKLLPGKLQAELFLGSFWAHDKTRRVGRIKGACLLIRMDDIRSVNFLDEKASKPQNRYGLIKKKDDECGERMKNFCADINPQA